VKTENEISTPAPAPTPGWLTVDAYKRMPANMKILRIQRDLAFKREGERLIAEEKI
jgi:hypothetical protein